MRTPIFVLRRLLPILALLCGWVSCRPADEQVAEMTTQSVPADTVYASVPRIEVVEPVASPAPSSEKSADAYLPEGLHDTTLVEVRRLIPDIVEDLRYATPNNFAGQAVYDCGRAFLRLRAAKALEQAQREFGRRGLRIKLYDAYRPRYVQWQLWEATPNKKYLGDPAKGSLHNKGCAVDLTLVNEQGQELDMGTEFDHFGVRAHTDYTALPDTVLANRRLLREVLQKQGFVGIRGEWWHFFYARHHDCHFRNDSIPCRTDQAWMP